MSQNGNETKNKGRRQRFPPDRQILEELVSEQNQATKPVMISVTPSIAEAQNTARPNDEKSTVIMTAPDPTMFDSQAMPKPDVGQETQPIQMESRTSRASQTATEMPRADLAGLVEEQTGKHTGRYTIIRKVRPAEQEIVEELKNGQPMELTPKLVRPAMTYMVMGSWKFFPYHKVVFQGDSRNLENLMQNPARCRNFLNTADGFDMTYAEKIYGNFNPTKKVLKEVAEYFGDEVIKAIKVGERGNYSRAKGILAFVGHQMLSKSLERGLDDVLSNEWKGKAKDVNFRVIDDDEKIEDKVHFLDIADDEERLRRTKEVYEPIVRKFRKKLEKLELNERDGRFDARELYKEQCTIIDSMDKDTDDYKIYNVLAMKRHWTSIIINQRLEQMQRDGAKKTPDPADSGADTVRYQRIEATRKDFQAHNASTPKGSRFSFAKIFSCAALVIGLGTAAAVEIKNQGAYNTYQRVYESIQPQTSSSASQLVKESESREQQQTTIDKSQKEVYRQQTETQRQDEFTAAMDDIYRLRSMLETELNNTRTLRPQLQRETDSLHARVDALEQQKAEQQEKPSIYFSDQRNPDTSQPLTILQDRQIIERIQNIERMLSGMQKEIEAHRNEEYQESEETHARYQELQRIIEFIDKKHDETAAALTDIVDIEKRKAELIKNETSGRITEIEHRYAQQSQNTQKLADELRKEFSKLYEALDAKYGEKEGYLKKLSDDAAGQLDAKTAGIKDEMKIQIDDGFAALKEKIDNMRRDEIYNPEMFRGDGKLRNRLRVYAARSVIDIAHNADRSSAEHDIDIEKRVEEQCGMIDYLFSESELIELKDAARNIIYNNEYKKQH